MDLKSEVEFEKKAERMLAGQRELPAGRDFRCFTERFRLDVNNGEFDKRYDETFPGAPGSKAWFDRKFRGKQ